MSNDIQKFINDARSCPNFHKALELIEVMQSALSYYAQNIIYWDKPIPLDTRVDRRTMQIVHDHLDSAIRKDLGKTAIEALQKCEKIIGNNGTT